MVGGLETGKQGPTPEEISIVRSKESLLVYALRVDQEIFPMVKNGEGKSYIGDVWGRPGEKQILLDAAGENLLTSIVRERRIPAMVFGEQNHYPLFEGRPHVVRYNDSLDNSSQYRRGKRTGVYSVTGDYTPEGIPLGAVCVNIRDREATLTLGSDNYIIDLSDPELKHVRLPEAPRRKTFKDDEDLTIATFQGEKKYKLMFDRHFQQLVEALHPKAFIDSGGGSYIYSELASGTTDIYIMFNEPHSEILPGLPAALAAKCTVISVNQDGTYSDYRANPDFLSSPEEYSHGNVPLFIASRTPELAEEAIGYYMRANNVPGEPRRLKIAA
ncbi:MAG: hypothetical protein AAB521_01005 [Patescibacteria group bacterium]